MLSKERLQEIKKKYESPSYLCTDDDLIINELIFGIEFRDWEIGKQREKFNQLGERLRELGEICDTLGTDWDKLKIDPLPNREQTSADNEG